MTYIYEKPSLDELMHFGVKGMRWGVRKKDDLSGKSKSGKEEPKPISAAKEAQAKAFEAEAAAIQLRIDKIKTLPVRDAYQKQAREAQVQDLKKYRDRALQDATATRTGKLTSRQKKILIGVGAAAAALAVVSAYTMVENGEANRLMMKGKALLNGGDFNWKKNSDFANKNLSADAIKDLVVNGINPGYGDRGTKMNCRRCTFAYEMRRRGYDVAATKTTVGMGQTPIGLYNALAPDPSDRVKGGTLGGIARVIGETATKKTEGTLSDALYDLGAVGRRSIDTDGEGGFASAIMNQLGREPNGSRGELGMLWGAGGGHSVAYEIVNGSPVVFDNQSGRVYKTVDELQALGQNMKSAAFTRLDNVPLNDDFLMRWVKNA